jgi:hypothetical protein
VDLSRGAIGVGDDDEWVDFEVGELAVDVNGVEAGDKVNQDRMHTLGNVLEEACSDLLVAGILAQVDGDEHLLSLGVDIANLNTTFVVEEDPVSLHFH